MAIRWIDGFDLYSSPGDAGTRYPSFPGFGSFQTGRFSGRCLRRGNDNIMFQPFGGSTSSTIAMGVAIRTDVVQNNNIIFQFEGNSGQNQVDIRSMTGGIFQATRNGTVLGSSGSNKLIANVWCYLEVEVVRHASAGSFKAYADGVQIINLTGLNTGGFDIDQVRWMNYNSNFDLDDMYVCDVATRLGERRVETIRPSADTAQKDWTPNSGTANFSRVNNTQFDGDTSYVSSSTVGQKDLYDITDLSFNPAQISAVQVTMQARKDDANLRQIRANIKSGATTANGATQTMATSYKVSCDIFETDPNTSAAWGTSAVNALQAGPEVVT